MELGNAFTHSEVMLPTLLLPKICTNLQTNPETPNDVTYTLNVNITTMDSGDKEFVMYSGYCNINLIEDIFDWNAPEKCNNNNNLVPTSIDNDLQMLELDDANGNNHMYPGFTQAQVWMDPVTSPHIFNKCNEGMFQNCSMYEENRINHIMDAEHNMSVSQDICDYNEVSYNIINNNYEVEEPIMVQVNDMMSQQNIMQTTSVNNSYEENEFECGAYSSQMGEGIMNVVENKDGEEQEYVELENENAALQQLKSLDTQSVVKQRKTILFLGNDSQNGQTVQKMKVSSRECSIDERQTLEDSILFDDSSKKKYQCDKCNQIFPKISALKRHDKNHDHDYYLSMYEEDTKSADESKIKCHVCGKSFTSEGKFELHCQKHGDPDLECDKCHKVLSSKFSLKNHLKTHSRKYLCDSCPKSFTRMNRLVSHAAKNHDTFMCNQCNFISLDNSEFEEHKLIHTENYNLMNAEYSEAFIDNIVMPSSPVEQETTVNTVIDNEVQVQGTDNDIAIAIANEVFQLTSKSKEYRKYNKLCGVCSKPFNRISDLKRHLIEHMVRNTMNKTPVSLNGTLNMLCEICRMVSFNKVDKYKAHLRKHANLTLYKCTFCNKSFSDSSNFSKHKKVHGSKYLQCDLCQRKFNTKKMLTNHIENHSKFPPINCTYCDRVYYFESTLKKHIRNIHQKELSKIVRCKFCKGTFNSLKEKWDHEWEVHKARKSIIDCLDCGSKFRKYTDLKKHCYHVHGILILSAKKLMKNNVIQVGPF